MSIRQASGILVFRAPRRGLLEVTADIVDWVATRAIGTGFPTLFCRQTSASLIIRKNAAAGVRADIEDFFVGLAPQDPGRYRHDDEGADEIRAHIGVTLTGVRLAIAVIGARLGLGTAQGIYLFEHRRRPPSGEIACHRIGE